MLDKAHRFHRRNHVQYVHRKGESQRGHKIAIRYVTNQDHDQYRVGVVVSKKVSKKAVVRNRIRRRVYEVVRLLDPPLRDDVDLIISIFDESYAEMEHKNLQTTLEGLIDKANIRTTDESAD